MGLIFDAIFGTLLTAVAAKFYEERRWLALSLFFGVPLLLFASLLVLAFWARS